MKGYNKLRKKTLDILITKLSKKFYYHGMHHTLDVLKVINQYIKRDKIPVKSAKILRLGVLMHDIGFTVSHLNHEENGAQIAKELMSELDFSKENIQIVKGLILATKIPQNPKTDFEKIICDADLDYLGRDDFYKISNLLYNELKNYTSIKNKYDWNIIQINFLETHKYHTKFAQKNRQPNKEKRIEELKQLVSKNLS